jgi:hypothetical protein
MSLAVWYFPEENYRKVLSYLTKQPNREFSVRLYSSEGCVQKKVKLLIPGIDLLISMDTVKVTATSPSY